MKIISFLLFVFLFLPFASMGETIRMSSSTLEIPLFDNPNVQKIYVETGTPFNVVKEKTFGKLLEENEKPTYSKDLWIHFSIKNVDSISNAFYLYANASFVTIYAKNYLGDFVKFYSGQITDYHELTQSESRDMTSISFSAEEEKEFFVCFGAYRLQNTAPNPAFGNQNFYYQKVKSAAEYSIPTSSFSIIYIVGISVVILFIIMFYISIKETVYIYYLLNLIFQLLFAISFTKSAPLNFLNVSYWYPKIELITTETSQFLFIGFYILFIIQLYEMGKRVTLRICLYYLAIGCFCYAAFSLFFLLTFANESSALLAHDISRIIVMPLNLVFIVWFVIKIRHPLLPYFIFAHLFFFAGALLSNYVNFTFAYLNPESSFYFFRSYFIAFQMGLLGEALCFSIALSLRVRLIHLENQKHAEAYIEQLQANKALQEEMNKELDQKVNEKTQELIQVYSEIEKQRERELKADYERKFNEMEMLALRSQMNPHFLFNSMNAIKYLMLIKRTDDAIKYLDDFSLLLRQVLQNSKKEAIPVDEELGVLKLYLELEQARLGNDYNFHIHVSNEENLSQFSIPGLLLQPFVENAIWHGLSPSEKTPKELFIEFDASATLVITIRDNGIGRKKSELINQRSSKIHQSMGMQIAQDRISLFNQTHDFNIRLECIDLYEDDEPSGTVIKFYFEDHK